MDNLPLYGVTEKLAFLAFAVLALPLASFLLNGLWLRKYPKVAGWTAVTMMGLAFSAAVALALGWREEVLLRPALFPWSAALAFEYTWMPFPGFLRLAARFGFYLDSISVMMTLVVTGISFLVHIYSVGYMREDRSPGRFFALLSFFTFTMLGLVAAHNLVQTFVFWELVGAASYLLIGFWYEKPAAVSAAKKAFIITRLADALFLSGLLLAGMHAQSFDFSSLNSAATAIALNKTFVFGGLSINLLFLTAVLLYAGAWGKSAMFPLHVWLPDAMEGPTPVSSLIHSATMVVAGVYLTARLFPLFSASIGAMQVVETTGAITALFAAVVACTQTDLKRILAFSTLSQLGLMMLGLGAAQGLGSLGFSASMFHVFTHAFFKCLLFLSAGMVIHAVHGQELKDTGGLRRRLPFTYGATLVACLAISGVWPFSGFFSKDEILLSLLVGGHRLTFAVALCTGGLTAFYMFRYFFLVFHGPEKKPAKQDSQHGEEAGTMLFPILVLALFSAAAGLAKSTFLNNVLPFGAGPGEGEVHGFGWLPFVASAVAAAGILTAFYLYQQRHLQPGESSSSSAGYKWIAHKFYLDSVWFFLGKRVGLGWLAGPVAWVERWVINGTFEALVFVLRLFSSLWAWVQNGRLQFYSGLGLAGFCLLYWLGKGGMP